MRNFIEIESCSGLFDTVNFTLIFNRLDEVSYPTLQANLVKSTSLGLYYYNAILIALKEGHQPDGWEKYFLAGKNT